MLPLRTPHDADADGDASRPNLAARYRELRDFSVGLTAGLAPEDFVVQSMDDVSPLKWHLAHTTWFFEYFILHQHAAGYEPFDARYHHLFNSYYVQAGERHCRAQRGYLSRPTVREVLDYRAHVDEAMANVLEGQEPSPALGELVELGLQHEQQHQELMLTDLKHVFSVNPLRPEYRPSESVVTPGPTVAPLRWIEAPAGLRDVGARSGGFSFDNERPRHRVYLERFALADRPTTCGEYLEFMADGGYTRPELWMSDGWAIANERGWTAPFYWERREAEWWLFTLRGMKRVEASEPVCHLSWYEADAFARWAGARLPTEFEWEVLAADLTVRGNLAESDHFHPVAAGPAEGADRPLRQVYGDVWEWTGSSYRPYPGFAPAPGAIGEYNGKFMSNQFVLRGGSCATPRSHLRATYRNFFHPDACWQFTGVRLAKDGG